FFQAEDGIRDGHVTGVQTCALPISKTDPPSPQELQPVLDKALAFLKSHQEPSGAFSPKRAGPGITALVAAGLLRAGRSPNEPVRSEERRVGKECRCQRSARQ